ncbi:MAG: DUF998 domain-containing protein [Bryobacteraceae bacterium]|nr:DUF998 domain-containing protein [Bryobacteraceae bacterium]
MLTTRCSFVLILLFVAASVAVHPAQPSFDPIDVALSYYMNGALGWLLGVGLISLGAGSLLLGVALRADRREGVSIAGLMLLGVWAVGCVIGGLFPPDPYGQWSRPPSTSGLVHGVAAMAAFVCFPGAAIALSRKLSVRLQWVAGVCALMTVLLFLCLAPVFQHRPPYAFGLVERVALGCDVGWLLMANITGLLGRGRRPSGS